VASLLLCLEGNQVRALIVVPRIVNRSAPSFDERRGSREIRNLIRVETNTSNLRHSRKKIRLILTKVSQAIFEKNAEVLKENVEGLKKNVVNFDKEHGKRDNSPCQRAEAYSRLAHSIICYAVATRRGNFPLIPNC
jgi:hypothetical protein